MAQERLDVADDLDEAQQPRLEHLPPTEREQLPRQIRSAVGGFDDLLDVVDLLRILQRSAQHAAVAANDEQDVVEVVRHTACELADRLEPLCLHEARLEHATLRDVAARDDDALDGWIVEEVQCDRFDRAPAAVLVARAVLTRVRRNRFRAGAREDVGKHVLVVRVHEVERGGADQLMCGVAEEALDGRAHVAHHAVRIEDGRDVVRVLDQGAEARLALAERLLGRLVRREQFARSLGDEPLELLVHRRGHPRRSFVTPSYGRKGLKPHFVLRRIVSHDYSESRPSVTLSGPLPLTAGK